ncbi:MAG: dUTP diphosphatase [bacterium]
MLLSDRDILNHIQRGDLEIDPFKPENLGSNSYDLHLAPELKTYKDDVLDARKQPEVETRTIPEDGLVLEPDQVYLGSTVEWTRTRHLVPILEGKSSMARLGLSVVSDGGFGDIGFEGCWTLELSVKQPVKIYPEMPICQIFYLTTGPCDMPYSDKSSARYANFEEPMQYQPSDGAEKENREGITMDLEDKPDIDHSLRIPVVQLEHAEDLPLPERATPGSSAVDLRAAVDEPLTLEPGDIELIDSGIKMSIPEGWEAQVRARSGLASDGIVVPNGPGTIDSDYRGEVKVLLQNLSDENFTVERGDRIAQLTVQHVERFQWDPRETLDETERSEGGFGSTGISEDVSTNGEKTVSRTVTTDE